MNYLVQKAPAAGTKYADDGPRHQMSETGGNYDKGYVEAELDINPDLWFFGCHFIGDPVMPGCLGLMPCGSWLVSTWAG